MKNLSVGKIRGLQQISVSSGILTICAMDHRGSLERSIKTEQKKTEVSFSDIVEHKLDLCVTLAPHASAILLDPIYGAAQCIAAGALPGKTGLLVSIEATGYEDGPEGRITSLLKDWNAEKIKRMGASAVKILAYYRPDLNETAEIQRKTIIEVAQACTEHDIPFLVEPVTYATKQEKAAGSDEFAAQKSRLVIQTAEQISRLPIDVLKSEFPADMNYEKDEGKLADYCRQLDSASKAPWVLLSAGVSYETFRKQVEIACKAGASGFLGGRAIWQESIGIIDRKERVKYLAGTASRRLDELSEIAQKYGTPWYRKLELPEHHLAGIAENWAGNY